MLQRTPEAGHAASAETAAALCKFVKRFVEIRRGKIRPQHIHKDKFRIGAFPQQKVGQPLLTAGTKN